MILPKLTEHEYEEIKEDFISLYEDMLWFINTSTEFFDNMYGNIYQDYY